MFNLNMNHLRRETEPGERERREACFLSVYLCILLIHFSMFQYYSCDFLNNTECIYNAKFPGLYM